MQNETLRTDNYAGSQSDPNEVQLNASQAEDRIDLIWAATLLWQQKKTIIRFALIGAVVTSLLVFFVIKPSYTAEAVFLPPQSAPGSTSLQLAGSLNPLGGFASLKGSGDIYIGILKSRSIAESLVKRFDLQKIYKAKRLSDAEKILEDNSKFATGKDSLITINVVDHDPVLAASLANGYLDALYQENGHLALTESAQRRAFFEQQLTKEKEALADAEVELKRTQEQTGLIAPAGQTTVALEATQALRAQIASKRVELGVLQQGATERNPAVVRVQTEIARLQDQLNKLEAAPGRRQPGSLETTTAKVPERVLEYVRKEREVKYHETLFELIARQYESARLDESREAPILQVIDRAVIPDRKSAPKRGLLILGSTFASAFLGAMWVFFIAAYQRFQEEKAA